MVEQPRTIHYPEKTIQISRNRIFSPVLTARTPGEGGIRQKGEQCSYVYLYFLLLLSPRCERPVLATEHVGHPICGLMTATDFPPENNNKCNGTLSLFTKGSKYYPALHLYLERTDDG